MLCPLFEIEAPGSEKLMLKLAALFSKELGTALFYSGTSYDSAVRSYLALFPTECIKIEDDVLTHTKGQQQTVRKMQNNPWDELKVFLQFSSDAGALPEWIGYLSYEMGATSDSERMLPRFSSGYPDAYFQRSALLLVHDRLTERLMVHLEDGDLSMLTSEQRCWIERLSHREIYDELLHEPDPYSEVSHSSCEVVEPLDTFEEYARKISAAKELIASGDIYQVNLSHRTCFRSDVDPFHLFLRLNRLNPAPFSAYLAISQNHHIVSSSPERLLRLKNGRLETRPIKGTIRRGDTPEEDALHRQALLDSEKDRAELLMITDLMRNDLGRVSLPGTVCTEKLRICEAYTNVFHMLSVITSEADPKLHPLDLMRACFPGGSITGCPKLRAMEVIGELEGKPRGIYTGSIGYFAANGDFDFNIAIRTLNVQSGIITAQVGGAIVYDSDPFQEYSETLSKGKSLFECISCIPI